MVKLYELTQQQQELKELADTTDLPQEALDDTFKALEGQFNEKAVSVIHVVNEFDTDIETLDNEIKRLQQRKKIATNKKERLREYLRSNMEANSITKIECPIFTITLAKGRDNLVITDADALDDEYVEVEVVTKPNKDAIKAALKAGKEVSGAHIEKTKTSLRIK